MFEYVNHYSMDSFYCIWVCMSLLGGFILVCLGMYFIARWIHFSVFGNVFHYSGDSFYCVWVCISLLGGFIVVCLCMYFITRGIHF